MMKHSWNKWKLVVGILLLVMLSGCGETTKTEIVTNEGIFAGKHLPGRVYQRE